jgi:hypothetical protein
MFEIKACTVSEKRSPDGYRDEFFRNKRNVEIGHYGQILIGLISEDKMHEENN